MLLRLCVVVLVALLMVEVSGCGGGHDNTTQRLQIVEWTFENGSPHQATASGEVPQVRAGVQFQVLPEPIQAGQLSDVQFTRNGQAFQPVRWTDQNELTFYRIDERGEPFDYRVVAVLHTAAGEIPLERQFVITPQ